MRLDGLDLLEVKEHFSYVIVGLSINAYKPVDLKTPLVRQRRFLKVDGSDTLGKLRFVFLL